MPPIGVNIHGLFLEGCRWNVKSSHLEESHPKELFIEMPVIWLEPRLIRDQARETMGCYPCPMYKTTTRKGTLSTTGHSTNFVMYLDLKSNIESGHWVRRGVALLCQLDE